MAHLPTTQNLTKRRRYVVWLLVLILGVLGLGPRGSGWLTTRDTLAQVSFVPIVTSNLRATSIASNSVTIAWNTNWKACAEIYLNTTPFPGGVPGPSGTPMVALERASSCPGTGGTAHIGQLSHSETLNTSNTSVLTTGVILLPDTTYYLYVRNQCWNTPVDSTCFDAYSPEISFHTLPSTAAPPPSSSTLKITSVAVTGIVPGGARISFTTNVAAQGRVVYDTASHTSASSYANANPPASTTTGPIYTGATTSNTITLAGLSAGTTYHYRVEVKDASGTVVSADRTFVTPSGVTGPGLIVTDIRADCVDTQCRIAYNTNKSARVEIRWDLSFHSLFGDYPNSTAESTSSSGLRSLLVPPAGGTPLVRSTRYHYRLFATDVDGGTFPSNDLIFETSASGSDHTFSTGKCPDGTDIGQCNTSRQYCDSGGNLITSCTSICGLVCPTGQTCNTSGLCLVDPALTGSPLQCDQSSCYDLSGQIISPAPAGCFSSWPRCNANTILKVQKDRGCNLWLTCATSIQTETTATHPAENLCLSLAACNSLGLEGQCNKYLPPGQCSNDPLRFCSVDDDCTAGGTCNTSPPEQPTKSLQDLTFQTPEDVGQIADLSGNVVAGLDWHQLGGKNVIGGMLPWQLMRQIGGNAQTEIQNGDFEYNPPSESPWQSAPDLQTNGITPMKVDFEDKSNSINHVLQVQPITAHPKDKHCQLTKTAGVAVDCSTSAALCTTAGDTCVADPVTFSGAASARFDTSPTEYYYAEVRLRAQSGNPTMRIQFGYDDYKKFSVGSTPTYVDVSLTAAWQRVTLGPISGMFGHTRLAVVCADPATCGTSEVWIDDVQVKPILQIDTNPTYITPSCRLFPREDSPSCDYVDQNNVIYQGWHGYCLEHDSQTGTCLSWWPVDVIKGETNIFGSDTRAGYDGPAPLYLCAEAAGYQGSNPFNAAQKYAVGVDYQYYRPYTSTASSHNCTTPPGGAGSFTIGTCTRDGDTSGSGGQFLKRDFLVSLPATGADTTFTPDQIVDVTWQPVGDFAYENPSWTITNDAALQGSTSFSDPAVAGGDGVNSFAIWKQVDVAANETYWIRSNQLPPSPLTRVKSGERTNAVYGAVVFDSTTGKLKRYELIENDVTDGTDGTGIAEPAVYQVVFHLKDICNKIVTVVDQSRTNQSFSSRVNSGSYSVPDINYRLSQDLEPFGSLVGPASGGAAPSAWSLLSVVQPNFIDFPPSGQSRASSPYGCNGACDSKVCTTEPTNFCATVAQIDECQHPPTSSVTGLPIHPAGECTGAGVAFAGSKRGPQSLGAHNPAQVDWTQPANIPYFALEHIRRVFASSYGVYQWNSTLQAYQPTTESIGQVPEICPFDSTLGKIARPAYPNDYCAIPPTVFNASFLNSTSDTAAIGSGSGSLGIKFNTNADADQVPLSTIRIDWGEAQDTFSYPFAPRNDPNKPHLFSHAYVFSRGDSRHCDYVINVCTYEIKIQLQDHWDWCNDAARVGSTTAPDGVNDTKCQSPTNSTKWFNTGLTVTVTP